MKKLNFVLIAVVLTSAIAFTTSCSKKKGCTDSTSTNYDADAKDDDGSCTYNGKVVFWYNEATADSLVSNGITSLTYYVNEKVIKTVDVIPNGYETSSPGCDDTDAFSVIVTEDLGDLKIATFSYNIKDQDGDDVFGGINGFVVTANSCNSIQLTY